MGDEVYRKVGRGGAGNFYSKKDIEQANKAPSPSDLESQPLPSSTSIYKDDDTTAPLTKTKTPLPEYVHTGRGGAGNWVAPSDLASKGLAQVPGKDIPAKDKGYRGGRGGAGNYVDPVEEERVRKEEEEKRRRENEERVAKDVEAGLARPERTYNGAGGSWELKDR
ncbi:hypothetical protein B0O99DRAFT_671977 [Bisporella sp. PMI_857]|nr:hypothetical protein B0O99DRAFT_671977 [Bisporella sp. PMI_857]